MPYKTKEARQARHVYLKSVQGDQTKQCKTCKKVLPCTEFHLNEASFYAHCKECLRASRRSKWLANNGGVSKKRIIHDNPGTKYNKLTVVNEAGRDAKGELLYHCKCECGGDTIIRASYVRSGHTKSCGCKKGLRFDDRTAPAITSVIGAYKNGAKRRQLSWSLSREDCVRLFSSSCVYCGADGANQHTKTKGIVFNYSGIDRIHNELGYDKENVVSCCYICNRAKGSFSFDEWAAWLSRLSGRVLTLDDVRTWQDRLFNGKLAEVISISGAA